MHVADKRASLAEPKRTRLRRATQLTPYLFLAPAFLFLALIVVYPLLFAIYLSVHDYVLSRPLARDFVGLMNFRDALKDLVFWSSLQRTILWVAVVVGGQFILGLVVALYLNQDFAGRDLMRGIVLIPWITPSAVVAINWIWMLDAGFGVVNDILVRLGLISSFQAWLSNPATAFPLVMLGAIWQGTPFFAIMLLAALQTIPTDILEAARVDGATGIQTFFSITIPLIFPTILITALLRTIWVANYVDLIFMTTRGGPGYSSYTLPILTLLTVRGGLDFGHGSALALMLGALLIIPISLYMVALRRQGILE